MKAVFYLKLAWTGICKNKKLYLPYLMTCIGMVMMYHIILFLQYDDYLSFLPGGSILQTICALGAWVVAAFSVIFLFYTNSFLIRRRKKEFGLYNILGMGKRNIGFILFWETLIIAVISLTIGLSGAILLSKFAELGLVNLINSDITYRLTVSLPSIVMTLKVFGGIFLLLFLNALRQVHTANPMALLHSENAGEKPPRANWLFGLLGFVLLAGAYYIAVSIEEPVSALLWFFAAVLMVISGTYALFIAGSVLFCRILQKKKKYYYRPNHFVSVSSLVYRMKRNGAGLASICILATMVLVMITSTACLYFGTEDSLRTRYPRDIYANIVLKDPKDGSDENLELLRSRILQITADNHAEMENLMDYRAISLTGMLQDGILKTDSAIWSGSYSSLCSVYFVPLSDYNRMMGLQEQLAADEVFLYPFRIHYTEDFLCMQNGANYRVAGILDDFSITGDASMDLLPSLFVIVPDLETSVRLLTQQNEDYNNHGMTLRWYYGFDSPAGTDIQIVLANQIREAFKDLKPKESGSYSYNVESLAANRQEYYSLYGGLFFLGILLSVVFILATVLIIYYKQISEGYEDQSRFEIMQKVGMTKREIRKSINSQMLTIFFLPLVTAAIHLAFAFPMIYLMLQLFNLTNLTLLLTTAGISILIFAVFYTLVYRITSNAYYDIVSGARAEAL